MNNPLFQDRMRSAALFEQALKYFPGGVNSPVRAFKSVFGPPVFIKRGDGCRITSVDDKVYLDFCCSWGPLILGHNHPSVREAIIDSVGSGTSFGAPTEMELNLGAFIVNHHSHLEQIRFVNSGTEAVMSAIRLARGFTGKNKIVKFEGCYHGHVDSLLVKAGSGMATFGVSTSSGIPESFASETLVLPLDSEEALENCLTRHDDIAAVIIEPVPANNGLLLQREEYLRFMREICTRQGVLLIFDEVISGFRLGFDGASGIYGVVPDLFTFGKIIGGGFPVGAFGGRAEIMQHISPVGKVYQAGTLSGNPVAMAAGLATLQQVNQPGFYEKLESNTKQFVSSIRRHCEKMNYPVQIISMGSIFWFSFDRCQVTRATDVKPEKMEYFKILHRFLLENGVYLGPSGYEVGFISHAHESQDLENASMVINQGMDHVFGK